MRQRLGVARATNAAPYGDRDVTGGGQTRGAGVDAPVGQTRSPVSAMTGLR